MSVVAIVAAVAEMVTPTRARLPIMLNPRPPPLPIFTLLFARKARVYQKRNTTKTNMLIAAPRAKQTSSMISSAYCLLIVCLWYIFLMVFVTTLMILKLWLR